MGEQKEEEKRNCSQTFNENDLCRRTNPEGGGAGSSGERALLANPNKCCWKYICIVKVTSLWIKNTAEPIQTRRYKRQTRSGPAPKSARSACAQEPRLIVDSVKSVTHVKHSRASALKQKYLCKLENTHTIFYRIMGIEHNKMRKHGLEGPQPLQARGFFSRGERDGRGALFPVKLCFLKMFLVVKYWSGNWS